MLNPTEAGITKLSRLTNIQYESMKVLLVGDSPTVNTGFSRCTRAACDELHNSGHLVTVLGMGYYGDPHLFPYPIYPCVSPYDKAKSYGGETRLAVMIERIKPDIVVILQDPWNIQGYFDQLDDVKTLCDNDNIPFTVPPVVGWMAVDSCNQKGEPLNRLYHIIVWTQFAIDQLQKGGYRGDYSIIPLGVDTNLFHPYDQLESRKEILGEVNPLIPLDAYIVGVVGRNQPRKRLDLTLVYFSEWVHQYKVSDAYLFLHVAPTGERGCDLRSLITYYGLKGRVLLSEPPVGTGNDESIMPRIYSCFDLFMTQSQGEGWHLPTLEAMACGVPCLVPNHSVFGDGGWTGDAVYKVDCSATALTAPLNGHPYTVGSIPDKVDTIDWLQYLYKDEQVRKANIEKGLQLAGVLTWDSTGRKLRTVLEKIHVKNLESILV